MVDRVGGRQSAAVHLTDGTSGPVARSGRRERRWSSDV